MSTTKKTSTSAPVGVRGETFEFPSRHPSKLQASGEVSMELTWIKTQPGCLAEHEGGQVELNGGRYNFDLNGVLSEKDFQALVYRLNAAADKELCAGDEEGKATTSDWVQQFACLPLTIAFFLFKPWETCPGCSMPVKHRLAQHRKDMFRKQLAVENDRLRKINIELKIESDATDKVVNQYSGDQGTRVVHTWHNYVTLRWAPEIDLTRPGSAVGVPMAEPVLQTGGADEMEAKLKLASAPSA